MQIEEIILASIADINCMVQAAAVLSVPGGILLACPGEDSQENIGVGGAPQTMLAIVGQNKKEPGTVVCICNPCTEGG